MLSIFLLDLVLGEVVMLLLLLQVLLSATAISTCLASVRRKSSLSLVPLVHHAKAKRCNKPRTPGCEDAAVGRSSEQTTKKTKPRIYPRRTVYDPSSRGGSMDTAVPPAAEPLPLGGALF